MSTMPSVEELKKFLDVQARIERGDISPLSETVTLHRDNAMKIAPALAQEFLRERGGVVIIEGTVYRVPQAVSDYIVSGIVSKT